MNDNVEKIWKKKDVSHYLSGGTEENQEKLRMVIVLTKIQTK